MPLLKNNAFVDDSFVDLGDDTGFPESGSVIASAKRLEEALVFKGKIGLRLANTDKLEPLLPHLGKIALITLPFPAFADGRSYSLARQLRLAGYRGELRAEGNVLPDQLQLMLQVGFDSFAVTNRYPLETWQAAARQMSLAYQRGLYRAAQETEVWSERHQGFAAWEEQPHAG